MAGADVSWTGVGVRNGGWGGSRVVRGIAEGVGHTPSFAFRHLPP